MNILQHPEAISSRDLQIWNNAAFDEAAGSSDGFPARVSWCPLQPITNRHESTAVDTGKENRSPGFPKSPKTSKKSLKPFLRESDPEKPTKFSCKNQGESVHDDGGDLEDSGSVDAEIEAIRKEIGRLSSRLEALLVKKAKGRIVQAKFLNPKKNPETPSGKRVRESPVSLRILQKGCSFVGPKKSLDLETPTSTKTEASPAISKFHRRGLSLGPVEIHYSSKFQQSEVTPLRSAQNRRKSCVFKLEGIEEEKRGIKETSSPKSRLGIKKDQPKRVAQSPANPASARIWRKGVSLGPSEISTATTTFRKPRKLQEIKEKKPEKVKTRSLSASPKSRSRSRSIVSDPRRGVAISGVKGASKGESQSTAMSLKPKVLFQETQNSVPGKRPSKGMKARAVASRYSLAPSRVSEDDPASKRRKWSLPESGKGEEVETNRVEDKCSFSIGESSTSSVLKIANKGMVVSEERSPPSIMKIAGLLPKIRTLRCANESPRDSGGAKRVAELVGRRSEFGYEKGDS